MALKDWIQLGELKESYGTFGVSYYKKGDRYNYVRVWRTGLPASEMKKRGFNGTYFVQYREGSKGVKKNFKTKPQALAFAKEYMRKN